MLEYFNLEMELQQIAYANTIQLFGNLVGLFQHCLWIFCNVQPFYGKIKKYTFKFLQTKAFFTIHAAVGNLYYKSLLFINLTSKEMNLIRFCVSCAGIYRIILN